MLPVHDGFFTKIYFLLETAYRLFTFLESRSTKAGGIDMKLSTNDWIKCQLITLSFVMVLAPLYAEGTLIAHWNFNNTGTDATGNGFDMTLRGNAAFTEESNEGEASLLLNGSTDYASSGELNFGDTFTITAWTYLETGSENIQTIIANAKGGSRIDGFKVFVNSWDTANGRILIETSDGTDRLDAATDEGLYEPGFWNHVAVTIDQPNGAAEIYYNGDPVISINSIISNFQVTGPVYIGAMLDPSWFWNGMIDDVRIYEGILTDREINETMNPLSSVSESLNLLPEGTELLGNYPNPFNPDTQIDYTLSEASHVYLEIFDLTGRRVQTLVQRFQQPGRYGVRWFAGNEQSGMYLCRLRTGSVNRIHKIMLSK